ncbi:MAG: glycosyltransferase family 9 protein [Gemmatimonadota bacterium]|nr:glycosyltransferase family 9 protein [Gemmatimonadota bacterium]
MAQTWPVTRSKRLVLDLVDALGAAAAPMLKTLWPPRKDTGAPVTRILVIELWLIGDVVLATPILRALRERFPGAEITLLGKPHAEELLRESGLADKVITFDFPWTANTGKYRPERYDRRVIRDLIRQLREERFDLTLDSRMDVRSSVIAYSTGAPRRIGYAFGGGGFLLTDALPASPNVHHKAHDWLALLKPLDDGRWNNGATATVESLASRFPPLLRVNDAERVNADETLRSLGIQDGQLIVGIHPGASRPRGRWPLDNFGWIADALASRHATACVVFVDPERYGERMPSRNDVKFVRASLREMMALMTYCDLFICNDSGPMHVADALGVPVVGIFTTGNPIWHRPVRENQLYVGRGTGHDFVTYPTREEVLMAAEEQIARVRSPASNHVSLESAER